MQENKFVLNIKLIYQVRSAFRIGKKSLDSIFVSEAILFPFVLSLVLKPVSFQVIKLMCRDHLNPWPFDKVSDV